jgi:hypothetical protein
MSYGKKLQLKFSKWIYSFWDYLTHSIILTAVRRFDIGITLAILSAVERHRMKI